MPHNNLPTRDPLAEKFWAVDQATDGVTHAHAHAHANSLKDIHCRHHMTPSKSHSTHLNHKQI